MKINIKFSSDFIIGYPGETAEDFNKTLNLMKNIEFINSYSFIFSGRPGTPAFNLPKVDNIEAKKRLIQFQTVAGNIKKKYRETLINQTRAVLFENKINNDNIYFGRDEYFNSVVVKSDERLTGTIKNIKILESNQNTLFGKIISTISQKKSAA